MTFREWWQSKHCISRKDRLLLDVLTNFQVEIAKMAAVVDSLVAEIAALTTSVQNEQTVEASAVTLISGFAAQLAAAVADAQAAGATPDQLAALNSLHQTIDTSSQALAAAVAANTPAAPSAGP